VSILALVLVVCVMLLILGFLFPRLSRKPQRGVDRAFETGARAGGHAPGKLGRWLSKPFSVSERAADESAAAGRRGRSKLSL
jgi:hypothetical protein